MPTDTKIYIKFKTKHKNRKNVLLDVEDIAKYKNKRLRYSKTRGVYYSDGNSKFWVAREILNLTEPWEYVKFITPNRLNLKKNNLKKCEVPKENRNRYTVQKSKTQQN